MSAPRLIRGFLFLGKKVQRANLEVIQQHARRQVGMDLLPLSGAEQTKALLTVLPGWEPAARNLGKHGAGFNAAPVEVIQWLTRLTGSWVGDLAKPPYLILETWDGESVAWSPWQDTAYSTLVAGETGSGKSFLLNQIVLAHVASSPKARTLIVEYGGSFLPLMAALGGQIIDKNKTDPETGEAYRFAPLACLSAHLQRMPEDVWASLLDDAACLTMDL